MHLKRLEINGFKSFANKTVLDFLPPQNGRFSITAIVGPNGSGKSNVTDAIRWVMGETSMKNIRGKKSEDVIFSGSESKGQLGMAEVLMVLDNKDKKIDLEFEEITVGRRLYRSGESEYIINGNKVRLLDVHLLFAQAQFAENSYSIVGQGMIDRMLLVSAQERKDLLDEASGIKEFQIKQHQARLKLNRTNDNLGQAERLVVEIEPHLKMLHRQVKKLEKRQEVEIKLRESQEVYYGSIYSYHQKEIDEFAKELELQEKKYKENFATLEKIQTELAASASASSRQEVFEGLQNRYSQKVKEKNDLERRLVVLEGQMHTEYGRQGKGNISWIENKIKDLNAGLENLNLKLKQIESDLNKQLEESSFQAKKLESLQAEKSQRQLKISRLQSQMYDVQSKKNYFEFSGLTAVKEIVQNRTKFGQVFGLVAELGEVDKEYRLALEVAAGSHMTSLVVKDEEVATKAINYLRENRLGIATFLPLSKIEGRRVNPGIENLLKEEEGVLGLATNLIKHSSKFDNIFSLVLGNTLVVKDLHVAKRIGLGRARMVTLDGDLVERNSVMKGGFRQSQLKGLGFSGKAGFSEEERAEEYVAEINLEKQELEEFEKEIESLKENRLRLRVGEENLREKDATLQKERLDLETEMAGLKQELDLIKNPQDFDKHLSVLQETKLKFEKELEKKQGELDALSKEIEDFNQHEEEKKKRIFDLQNQMQTVQLEVNNIVGKRSDIKVSLARLETKQEDLVAEVENDMSESIISVLERKPAVVDVKDLDEIADRIQKLKYQLSLIGGIDEEVVEEYKQTKERYDFLDGQIKDLEKATDDLEVLIAELDKIMKKKRNAAFKKIKKEFDKFFKILFDGGSAKLEEMYDYEQDMTQDKDNMTQENEINEQTEDGDIEDKPKKRRKKVLTGIDVIACPPGKKIKHLNSLSGGERTLTSIALICAILSNNPSPFVVLDEVEAALDEANSERFARIMSELSTESQFIIITHNRVTMHHADALYGVVMKGDGVSQLMSVKLDK